MELYRYFRRRKTYWLLAPLLLLAAWFSVC